jgi:hypothetical protein
MVAATATALLALAGCGDDDESGGNGDSASADLARYCQLTAELDKAGQDFFKKLEQQNASEQEFEKAEREFIEQNEAKIQEVAQVAPAEIAPDVEILVESQRSRAGLSSTPVNEEQVQPAEQRLREFEQQNCQN